MCARFQMEHIVNKASTFFAICFVAATSLTAPIGAALDQANAAPTHPVFLMGLLAMLGSATGLIGTLFMSTTTG